MQSAYGVSKEDRTEIAVKKAYEQCLTRLENPSDICAGFIFWGSNHDAAVVSSTVHSLLPQIPVIGCSTDGEISGDGLSVDSICCMLLSSPRISAKATVVDSLTNQNSQTCGRSIAEQLKSEKSRILFLLPDGLTGNGSQIIRGAQKILGSQFIIAGGTAGDQGRFQQTWQISNGKAYSGALVGLMLESEAPLDIGFGVLSGWRPIGLAKEVTHAEGNIVYKIEDETTLDVYMTFLGEKGTQLPAIGVEYPFGLVDQSGCVDEQGLRMGEEYLLMRAPMSVNHNEGWVQFAAEIPQGSKIKMTMARSNDIIEASREAAKRATQNMQGKPEAVFFFSCMARKLVLGRRTNREIEVAQEMIGRDVPLIGFYTYGEIANCGEKKPTCRFHNETATFLCLREKG